MYCPHCAARLAVTDDRCPRCDLDVRPVAQLLQRHAAGEGTAAIRAQHWQRQRHATGLLLVMCSLLVGCFIPLALGVFSGVSWLGALITALAGLAGVLLILGAMLILASEGVILTSTAGLRSEPAGQAVPLLEQDITMSTGHKEQAAARRSERERHF
ncbi:MAG: hypothetical protein OHK0022_05950 [Roseiflexaceae bacterium]